MSTQTLEAPIKPSKTKVGTEEIVEVIKNVAPANPALRRLHHQLNESKGAEANITSYDRMHNRHNRS